MGFQGNMTLQIISISKIGISNFSFFTWIFYFLNYLFSTNLKRISQILGNSCLPLHATPAVVRRYISDSRENPQVTTTPHCKLSGPLEHKLKRTGVSERLGGKRKGVETTQLNINAEVSQRLRDGTRAPAETFQQVGSTQD